MNIINAENLTKSYTERKLLDKASFYLQEGEKVGVIGINGTGKSTLLKIIAGLEEPDEGQVTCANHIVVRYLPQNPVFDPEMTVLDSVLTQCVLNFVGSGRTERTDADAHAQEQKWSLESDAKSMMTRLGITDFTQKTGELSGGQRKRLALVAALLVPCDVLILDEPTNHLDSAMADWLENYLKKWRGALVMITHDRYFLDSVCNRIVEVDKGAIYSYETNYSGYLERKAEREESAEASERKRQSVLRKELEWVRQNPKGRQAKSKARLARFNELSEYEYQKRNETQEIFIPVAERLGNDVIEFRHVSKSFGDRLLIDDLSFIIPAGAIVGVIGPNGAGKSTLFKMIAGQEQPDQGEILIGKTVRLSLVDQSREALDNDKTVFEDISEGTDLISVGRFEMNARAYLGRFNFKGSDQQKKVGNLSGGERGRLHLAKTLMKGGNVLLLDEPSNDLDVETLRALEDALLEFAGSVIVISHDRWFLDRIATHILAFEGNSQVTFFEGNYQEYEADKRKRLGEEGAKPKRLRYKPVTR